MTRLAGLRVLVVHDWILPWAGAERALEHVMSVVPHADLVVGVRTAEHVNALTARARETWVGRLPFARSKHRWFVPFHYAAFAGLDTRAYDLVISNSHAFAKAVRPVPGRPHVCWCHSPPRYLWDMGPAYVEQSSFIEGAALRLTTPILRVLDRRSARGVTDFLGNSRFVVDRIRQAYGRDATVLYPAVGAKAKPRPGTKREDFLLVLGRLVAYKRVDLAIEAAKRTGIRLLIAGDGRERARLERIAGPTTTFLGDVDEATAADLMERCRAFVFCAEEDFGIAPVEANAHGAPVVGFGRGGLTETMIAGETAVFFERQSVDDVAAAIDDVLKREWNDAAIRRNAERFNADRFQREFTGILERAISAASPAASG